MAERKPNRLIHEKSPYLLQHAHNPVDWYAWSEEAFKRAEAEDKPIFLSIGYSTCHWCHVMEKESFEDQGVADLMNDTFICIKVDREERPDLDHVYMTVCSMVTGAGGWPLTIVMTPDKRPFFAATYIPRENRFGRVGLLELIPRIGEVWRKRRGEVLQSAGRIMEALNSTQTGSAGGGLDVGLLRRGYDELAQRFDAAYGGFGSAPKFPTPHQILFLLRCWKRFADPAALAMVEKTLQGMRLGGIFDQVGFGFHRYSTDALWLVPHFEKMLYDQALLTLAYLETHQATGKAIYSGTARGILNYVLRDMLSPEGAFYSAEDADSEGVEGRFYLWSEKEIRQVLEQEEADLVVEIFNVSPEGNFLEESTRRRTGENILHLKKTLEETAERKGLAGAELKECWERARKRLFAHREGRVHPHKDDKVLTDWNGLMIAALARGAMVLRDETYAAAAGAAARFIRRRLCRPDGGLLHRYRDGEAGIPGHLDDYAFMVWGLIELYQATFDEEWLQWALDLNARMVQDFWDEEAGGFFFTARDAENLIVRGKEISDGAVPSGNSVVFYNLLRLSRITGESALEDRAARLARAFSGQIGFMPSAYALFLAAGDFALGPSSEVVLVGGRGAEDTQRLHRALGRGFRPNMVLLLRPTDEVRPRIDTLTGYTTAHAAVDGKATAYVCRSQVCKTPTVSVEEMLSMLD